MQNGYAYVHIPSWLRTDSSENLQLWLRTSTICPSRLSLHVEAIRMGPVFSKISKGKGVFAASSISTTSTASSY